MSSLIPPTAAFQDVTVIIAAINETASLRETVQVICQTCAKEDLAEIILVIAKFSTPECVAVCHELEKSAPVPLTVLVQTRRYAGGAYQDAIDISRGSHVIMMAADLETDPHCVPDMIQSAKDHPNDITCASRWLKPGAFHGYNPLKYILNYIFQKIMRLFFGGQLTDWTYAYRIYPRTVVQSIHWQELRHPFFLETILKPLRAGVAAREIPTTWKAREEGESQNTFMANFLYFKTAWKVLWCPKADLVKRAA